MNDTSGQRHDLHDKARRRPATICVCQQRLRWRCHPARFRAYTILSRRHNQAETCNLHKVRPETHRICRSGMGRLAACQRLCRKSQRDTTFRNRGMAAWALVRRMCNRSCAHPPHRHERAAQVIGGQEKRRRGQCGCDGFHVGGSGWVVGVRRV